MTAEEKIRITGTVEEIRDVVGVAAAFTPFSLPPREPALSPDAATRQALDEALLALGRLDIVTQGSFIDRELFLYIYVRKEAVLSSQIEGTQSSLSDLLVHELDEAPGVPLDDVKTVSNYVAALEHGLARMRDGFPLSARLLRECHGLLLKDARGGNLAPGEFRSQQVWIGGDAPSNASFVPPPAHRVPECMSELEKYLHSDDATPLIRAALSHVQFETIHPFWDGNGRIGRLLVTFALHTYEVLSEPLLYLSLYFRTHRQAYYDQLMRVRTHGDWEGWVHFFARAVRHVASEAVAVAQQIGKLGQEDAKRIAALGRSGDSAASVHEALMRRPIARSNDLCVATGRTPATVNKALIKLRELGIVGELTGKKRNRIYYYPRYYDALDKGIKEPHP